MNTNRSKRARRVRARRTNVNTALTLTGGSGDVNPQYVHNSVTQSGSDTTTTQQITLPIDRLMFGGNRIGSVEVLSVTFDWRNPLTLATALSLSAALTTKSFGTTKVNYNEPTAFAFFHLVTFLTTAAGSTITMPYRFDCTDAAGHGILVATDSIFLSCSSSTTSQANTVDVKIEYRYKNITVTEYVGVVQSQS
jgi:hypothetical protein